MNCRSTHLSNYEKKELTNYEIIKELTAKMNQKFKFTYSAIKRTNMWNSMCLNFGLCRNWFRANSLQTNLHSFLFTCWPFLTRDNELFQTLFWAKILKIKNWTFQLHFPTTCNLIFFCKVLLKVFLLERHLMSEEDKQWEMIWVRVIKKIWGQANMIN